MSGCAVVSGKSATVPAVRAMYRIILERVVWLSFKVIGGPSALVSIFHTFGRPPRTYFSCFAACSYTITGTRLRWSTGRVLRFAACARVMRSLMCTSDADWRRMGGEAVDYGDSKLCVWCSVSMLKRAGRAAGGMERPVRRHPLPNLQASVFVVADLVERRGSIG